VLLRGSLGLDRPIGFLRLTTEARWQRGEHLPWLNNLNQPGPAGVRPLPLLGNVYEVQNGADDLRTEWFTSLSGDTRLFSWGVNYTLATEKNEVDDMGTSPSNPLYLRGDWGYAANDVRHRLWSYFFYHAPHGFRVSLNGSFTSGASYDITTGRDDDGDAVFNDRPAGLARNTGRAAALWSVDGRLSWTHNFGREVSSAGRSMEVHTDAGLRGGAELDMPTRSYQMKLYVQVVNLLNHPGFMGYDGVLTSPSFGQPTASAPGRRAQLGLAFLF
jgi:hypothetical protein